MRKSKVEIQSKRNYLAKLLFLLEQQGAASSSSASSGHQPRGAP
jgi:hypothetical protein